VPRDPETLRAFFAVEIGEEAHCEAEALARQLRSGPGGDAVRWVRAENYHVTLRFLGQVEVERLAPLTERVRLETRSLVPFPLRLARLRAFPSPRHPRVVTLELEPREPLAELAGAVERATVACGFAPEERPFRAHLTLGRVRERGFSLPSGTPAPAPFDVGAFVLLRSVLAPSGPTYTALERVALGDGDSS
jgi:2'-5' RNA ligase